MIKELQAHLARTTLIQIADILSLYATPAELRFKRNWTAYCRQHGGSAVQGEYCPGIGDDSLQNYYAKDIEYAAIRELGETPKIDFNPDAWKWEPKLVEDFDSSLNREIITSTKGHFSFQPNKVYEIFEKYADFDFKIYKDTLENPWEYEANLKRLFTMGPYLGNLPEDRDSQLMLCADRNQPFFTVQGPPGTGKTSFLGDLVVKVIKEGIFAPGDIVCLAQTNRAADEIRRKLEAYSAEQLPNRSVSVEAKLADSYGKIYVSTVYKNPGNSARQNRKLVLIDEASQIPISVLLYGLRYAAPDAVLRLFGDQLQLAPVSSYIRDLERVPSLADAKVRYLNEFENMQDFLTSGIGGSPEALMSKSVLEKTMRDAMLSPFGQSLFGLPDFGGRIGVENLGNIITKESLKAVESYKLVFRENYRQEEDLHKATSSVFYGKIKNHVSKFDMFSANVKDYANHSEGEHRARFLKEISHDHGRAAKCVNSFSSVLQAISRVAGRFMSRLFGSTAPNQADKDNLAKSPGPFVLTHDADLLMHFKDFFENPAIVKEVAASGLINTLHPEQLFTAMQPYLRNKLLVVKHDFQQESDRNMNRLEGILSCLFLYLWKKEKHRVGNGIGIVVPFRNQEVYTSSLYLKSFAKLAPISGRPAEWCATPERFQGRDISRAVFAAVNSSIDSYKEINTMFSENKLNVATSRAASQQVLIVNANLVNRDSLQKLKDFATSQDDEVSKRILGEYPIKYLEKLAEYVRYAGDGICVLNVK